MQLRLKKKLERNKKPEIRNQPKFRNKKMQMQQMQMQQMQIILSMVDVMRWGFGKIKPCYNL